MKITFWLIFISFVVSSVFFACDNEDPYSRYSYVSPFKIPADADTILTESGLRFIYVKKGSGRKVTNGVTIEIRYSEYLKSRFPTYYYSSRPGNREPDKFKVDENLPIKGFYEGLLMMREGDMVRLLIPYELAYGADGHSSGVPPYSDLIFDIEMDDIVEGDD